MKKTITLALTLALSLAITACTPPSTPGPVDPGPVNPGPVNPGPVDPGPLLPQAGAPVGSGTGVSTVYLSPNDFEIGMMTLINEVRVSGTLNGGPVPAGSCAEGVKGLSPLRYSGLMAHAARMHTHYRRETLAPGGHVETLPDAPSFWGAEVWDRVDHSAQVLNIPVQRWGGEIIMSGARSPEISVTAYLQSAGHCKIIMKPSLLTMGAGWEGDLNLPDPTYDEYMANPLSWNKVSTDTVVFGY